MKDGKLLCDKREDVSLLPAREAFLNHLSPSLQACVLRLTTRWRNTRKVHAFIEFARIAFPPINKERWVLNKSGLTSYELP